MPLAPDPAPPPRTPRVSTLVLLIGLSVVTLNLFLPSLPAMAGDFAVSYGAISLSLSLFMVASGALQLVVGPLSDRYGRRPVLVWGLVVFVAASVGCALAWDLTSFIIFRSLQGASVVAAVIPRTIVRDTSPPREAAARLGTIGAAMALAPMFGPILGGVIDSGLGWRASFWTFALMGIAGLALVRWDVRETNLQRQTSWSATAQGWIALVQDRGFWTWTAVLSLSMAMFFIFLAGAPLVGTAVFGLTTTEVGVAVAATPLGFMLGNILCRVWVDRIGLRGAARLGRSVTLLGMVLTLALWSLWALPAWAFFALFITIGIGNGFSLPVSNVGVMSVRDDLAGSAAGLSGAIAITVSGAMTALTGWAVALWPPATTLLILLVVTAALGTWASRALPPDGAPV